MMKKLENKDFASHVELDNKTVKSEPPTTTTELIKTQDNGSDKTTSGEGKQ